MDIELAANEIRIRERGKRENQFLIEEEILCFRRETEQAIGRRRSRRVKSELATIAFRTPPHMLMCVECETLLFAGHSRRRRFSLIFHVGCGMRASAVLCPFCLLLRSGVCGVYVKHLFTVFGYISNSRVIRGEKTEEQKHERKEEETVERNVFSKRKNVQSIRIEEWKRRTKPPVATEKRPKIRTAAAD